MLAIPGLLKSKKNKAMSKSKKKSKGKLKTKIILDSYHYHEAIDRLYMIGRMIEDFIIEHPVCMKHKKIRKNVEKALGLLADAYQMSGSIDAQNDSENQ